MKKLLLILFLGAYLFAGNIGFELNKNSAFKYYRYVCVYRETQRLHYLLKQILSSHNFKVYSELLEDGKVSKNTPDILNSIYNIVSSENFNNEIKSKKGIYYMDLGKKLRTEIDTEVETSGFFDATDKISLLLKKTEKFKNVKPVRMMKKELVNVMAKYIKDLKKAGIEENYIKRLIKLNRKLENNANL